MDLHGPILMCIIAIHFVTQVSTSNADKLFTDLWSTFTSSDNTSGYIESVECLRMSTEKLNDLVTTTWAPLVTRQKGNVSKNV